MPVPRTPSKPMFLRNAFAIEAHRSRSSVFKDKRTPRGGDQNWVHIWLVDALEEEDFLRAALPHKQN